MKKVVLGFLSLMSLTAMGQSFTVDDTLSAGDAQLYFTADSNAVNYDAITGSGVTWDYSTLTMYAGSTNNDTIKWASDSPDFGDFPNATYHDDMAGGASGYFTNYADSVVSYGFAFQISGNDVKVMHNIDEMKMMNLPMNLNDTFTDSTYGTADVMGSMAATAGDVTVIADGTGTLLLGTSTFTNVIRIKTVEVIETTITLPPPINTVTGNVTRTEYRYYDLANQNEALMIHGDLLVQSSLFNGGYTAVYSSVSLDPINASVSEEKIENVEIYPNPANDFVNISTDNVDELVVMNALGQRISTITKPQAIEQIDLTDFETGIYFIEIKKGNASLTKKLVIK